MLRLLVLLNLSETVRTAFFVSVLPIAGPGLGFGAALIGVLAGVHYLADGLAKGPGGLLTERVGLGPLLLASALLGMLALLGLHFAPYPLLGAVGCGAWGVAYAALWPGVMNVSQSLALPGRTARALAVSNLSVAPAIALGSLGAGPLMQVNAPLAWALLLVVQGMVLLLALSLWGVRVRAEEVTGSVWRGWSRVAALLPSAFVQTLAPGLLVTVFYPLLARLGLHLRDLLGSGALALLVFGLSWWWMGRRADHYHPRRALIPGLLLLACTFALAALPGAQERLWWLSALLGVGYGAFITGWNGLVALTLPEGNRAAAWGTVMAVESLGYAVGPLLGGLAWQLHGQAGVFSLGALAFLLAVGYDLLKSRGEGAREAGGSTR